MDCRTNGYRGIHVFIMKKNGFQTLRRDVYKKAPILRMPFNTNLFKQLVHTMTETQILFHKKICGKLLVYFSDNYNWATVVQKIKFLQSGFQNFCNLFSQSNISNQIVNVFFGEDNEVICFYRFYHVNFERQIVLTKVA